MAYCEAHTKEHKVRSIHVAPAYFVKLLYTFFSGFEQNFEFGTTNYCLAGAGSYASQCEARKEISRKARDIFFGRNTRANMAELDYLRKTGFDEGKILFSRVLGRLAIVIARSMVAKVR